MKFIKGSIILLFVLSLLSAGSTYYLSTIRENEKEKRLYAEAENARLETEKADMKDQLSDLTEKLDDEKQAHQETKNLLRQKSSAFEQLKREADDAQKALENAQKRNSELEQILSQLELRMQQAEAQKNLPGSEAGFINVTLTPTNEQSAPADSNLIEPQVIEKAQEEASSGNEIAALTPLPQPPKKRRFLSLFRRKQKSQPAPTESMEFTPVVEQTKTEEPTEENIPQQTADSEQKEKKDAVWRLQSNKAETVSPALSGTSQPAPAAPEKSTEAKPASPQAKPADAQGSILLINRKYNFVVVNLGTRHGINLDDILSIQQKGAGIAKARVEKLYDDYCAAYITEEQSEHPIGEGDAVVPA